MTTEPCPDELDFAGKRLWVEASNVINSDCAALAQLGLHIRQELRQEAKIIRLEKALEIQKLTLEAKCIGDLERGIRGAGGVFPDWVYEARAAIKHRDESIPWERELLDAIGWESGTVWQAFQAIRRLVAVSKDNERNQN